MMEDSCKTHPTVNVFMISDIMALNDIYSVYRSVIEYQNKYLIEQKFDSFLKSRYGCFLVTPVALRILWCMEVYDVLEGPLKFKDLPEAFLKALNGLLTPSKKIHCCTVVTDLREISFC